MFPATLPPRQPRTRVYKYYVYHQQSLGLERQERAAAPATRSPSPLGELCHSVGFAAAPLSVGFAIPPASASFPRIAMPWVTTQNFILLLN